MSTDPSETFANAERVQTGSLYVVATPIGNLRDLSPRAQAVLHAVDVICAEDTRTTGSMLGAFGIQRRLVALHDHNEDRIAADLVGDMQGGKTYALVSDAGTPLVSDPGFALVRAARAAGVAVFTVPGPCAVIAALSIAGLATDEFLFAGFLPNKSNARRERLLALAREPRTWVVYESSHRIADCVADLAELLPTTRICLARELTKKFEESITRPAAELPDWLAADSNRSRGEFVLVGAGADKAPGTLDALHVLKLLLQELPPSRAAKLAAELSGVPRKALYEQAMKLAKNDKGESDDDSP